MFLYVSLRVDSCADFPFLGGADLGDLPFAYLFI
jgi:hypothetical protein